MSSWIRQTGLLAAITMLGLTTIIGAAEAQNNPVDQRRALMKANGDAMQSIKALLDNTSRRSPEANNAKTMAEQAAAIAKRLNDAIALFPPGTDKPVGKGPGETQALLEAWSNQAEFASLGKAAAETALKFEATVKLYAIARAANEFADLGKACGACHNKFRAK